jgi:nitrogen fixation NifU-like protein
MTEKSVDPFQELFDLLGDAKFFGRMNDPTSSAFLKGPCGDSMEFYLLIQDNRILDIRVYTEGCGYTRLCALMTANLACGRTVNEALKISAGEIITRLKAIPEDHLHCSILAVSTLYRAIADYLLKPLLIKEN